MSFSSVENVGTKMCFSGSEQFDAVSDHSETTSRNSESQVDVGPVAATEASVKRILVDGQSMSEECENSSLEQSTGPEIEELSGADDTEEPLEVLEEGEGKLIENRMGEEGIRCCVNSESGAGPSRNGAIEGDKKLVLTIAGKKYGSSSFVHNKGFLAVQAMLRGNLKAVLTACTLSKVHDIMNCNKLHFSNRAVVLGDRYVKINMLVENPAKVALLTDPLSANSARFCESVAHSHDASTCTALHLLPGIVFVGPQRLQVGYFESELHDNIGFQRLKNGTDIAGRWCTNRRPHVIVTCKNIHYNRGGAYKEVPRIPARPLAILPSMRPRLCPATRLESGPGRRGDRNKVHGRARSRASLAAREASPATCTETYLTPGMELGTLPTRLHHHDVDDASESRVVLPVTREQLLDHKKRVLNALLVVLVAIVALLTYMLF
ncbi:hypothetical protein ERJ75_000134400 [Trypanosoma vivax]|nr:hypothetical protein TRVL_02493 [Trypanosoma vivax]KAH8619700.1 hypothetical protein ERJ75_000134400 [Trypanosoma vivax]